MEPRPSSPTAARPAWSAPGPGVRRGLATTGVVIVAAFSMTTAIAYASQEAEAYRPGSGVSLILPWLVGLVLAGGLVVRRRYPVQVCAAAAACAIVLPLDSLTALVALGWVVARRSGRSVWVCGALTAVATAAALIRDWRRTPDHVILATSDPVTDEAIVLPTWAFVLVGVLAVATAVGVGLLRRWRETARTAVDLQHLHAAVADGLRTEMTRQEEREVIAREVHDTVAHQLSLVALRAAALEVTAGDDDTAREAAQTMRSAAHQALEEMRVLIELLRSPDGQPPSRDAPTPGFGLGDLPTMLDSARDAGARIRSTVFVSDADQAPPALTRAVYRIVQESLTNALKHAPGTEVMIDLRAGPSTGAWLCVRNPLMWSPAVSAMTPSGGHGAGIVGMRERAALLGGSLEAGPQDGWFVVTAQLPWPVARAASAAGIAPSP